ncbi:acetyl-CoA synthetase-like protein [Linderina pennispora]|uniref:Acetyl-CoA synthetase-like protein n=1 Tax=Linderina pennispora TaxID=61395 RepID=A0A1Y1WC70_9FUNG|nr:acetyl-CoA synthetase-like protein [Linderina pennispora]ORX71141.1 acetyl-CoA synthetase-like protein [Linderina pennispora]
MYIVSPLKPHAVPMGDIPTHMFTRAAHRQHTEKVLIDAETGQGFTINDIIQTSQQLAQGLAHMGLANTVIAAYGRDPRNVFVYYAALLSGNAFQLVSCREQLEISQAKLVFVEGRHMSDLGTAAEIIAFDRGSHAFRTLSDLLASGIGIKPRAMAPEAAEKALAILAGGQRPVMLSHYGVLAAPAGSGQGVVVAGMPGIGNIAHLPLLAGCTVVQLRECSALACLAAIAAHNANVLLATNELLLELRNARRRDGWLELSGRAFPTDCLQTVFVWQMHAPGSFKQQMQELLRARVVELYGFVETGLIAGLISESPPLRDSVGVLCANVTARIVCDGRDLKPGEYGEIWVKTPRLMMGYLGGSAGLVDGFFCTGDFGTVTEDGVVVVMGRVDDVVRMEERHVPPVEIERAVRQCAGVADCAVVRAAGPGHDVPFVFAERSAPAAQISAVLAELAGAYPGICGRFVDMLPRTATGAVARTELVSML